MREHDISCKGLSLISLYSKFYKVTYQYFDDQDNRNINSAWAPSISINDLAFWDLMKIKYFYYKITSEYKCVYNFRIVLVAQFMAQFHFHK